MLNNLKKYVKKGALRKYKLQKKPKFQKLAIKELSMVSKPQV